MAGLKFLVLVLALGLAGCATASRAPRVPVPDPAGVPSTEGRDPGGPRTANGPAVPPPVLSASAGLQPSPLDLEHWPFGWVDDPQGPRLGRAPRFWSDQKLLWTEALDPRTPPARAVQRWNTIAARGSAEEQLRAAWWLWLTYHRAGLDDDARVWLDRAGTLTPGLAVVTLERIWDQVFRLRDLAGGRGLWPDHGLALFGDDARKAALLRQKLFLGTEGLTDVGADGFVSTLILDRDDLWAATWNGAVVRWSLVTGEKTLVWNPGRVAPVNRLVATGWFLYAFQDQGLLRYSKVTGTWRTFPYPPGWTGLRVTGAVAEGEQSLTVGYLGQGLWRWNDSRWTPLDAGSGGPFVTALAADGRGGYLVGTKDRGLWTWVAGVWSAVSPAGGPVDISVLAPGDGRWAVGTWGEGTWVYDGASLVPVSQHGEFVAAAAWDRGPLWGLVDEGLRWNGPQPANLGPLDGLPAGGVTSLVVWEGRWLWGTSGQGVGWWSEHEDPTVLR